MTFSKFGKRRSLVAVILVISLGLLSGAGYFWWREVYTRPDNVFERMLNSSMSTNSVTKTSNVEGQGQKISQSTELYIKPEPKVHSLVRIAQDDQQKSVVVRETLTSERSSFVRLVSIQTTQQGLSGKPYDFSSITGIWGQSPADETNNSLSQLYGQNVAVPFVNLTVNQRRQLIEQIEKDGVYGVKYETVKRISYKGRPSYQYVVQVKPSAFVKMMKTVGQLVGVKGFKDVNPNDYKNLPPVNFTFTVDILSGNLTVVDYGNGQVEEYSSFGKRNPTADPTGYISMLELQQRLQKLQQ